MNVSLVEVQAGTHAYQELLHSDEALLLGALRINVSASCGW